LTVTYECAVFTYYVEQLNKIVESMEYASDAYWGDPQRYQFKASIDSFGFQTELAQDDERIVRSTFTLKINGYIIPEILQKDVTALKKFSNITKTTFTLEDEPTTPITEAPLPPIPFTCAPVTVLNSGSTYTSSVDSGGTLILPNQTININSTGSGLIPSVGTIGINLTDSGSGAIITPTSTIITGRNIDIKFPTPSPVLSGVLFKTIEPTLYTSYRTYDEGWRAQNGWFNYIPPSNPKAVAELDYVNPNYWYLLKNNLVVNGQSNKTRFVSANGDQNFSNTAQGHQHLLIDKLTNYGILRTNIDVNLSWNQSIDLHNTTSVTVNGIVYNDWYLISVSEYITLMWSKNAGNFIDQQTLVTLLSYSVFAVNTSSTHIQTTSDTFRMNRNTQIVAQAPKTFTNGVIMVCKLPNNIITAP
jgi:hypothetical protein